MSDERKIGELPTIEGVFGLLDRWRHLPAYQLERRADIFFALFLPEVLREFDQTKTEVLHPIIPEFPIKKADGKQSEKADYFALSEDSKLAFIVELKTDMASRRSEEGKKQEEFLNQAVKQEMKGLVDGILEICRKTKEKEKYVHLLWCLSLSNLGLLEGVNERIDSLYKNAASVDPCHPNRHGEASIRGKRFAEALRGVKPANISWPKAQLVYGNL